MSDSPFEVYADCEIVTQRDMAYEPAQLFAAWTRPELLQQWWGPNGFTNTFEIFDLREGGKWKFVMHGPDKGDHANECTFLKIEPPNLIAWDRISQPLFRVVATFTPIAQGTRVRFRMQFDTKEACDKLRGFAPEKNEENFDRLERVLAEKNDRK